MYVLDFGQYSTFGNYVTDINESLFARAIFAHLRKIYSAFWSTEQIRFG